MVRALVTGASGYIGSRLVRDLHVRGVAVGCVARDPSRVSFDLQQALREAIAEEAHTPRPTP